MRQNKQPSGDKLKWWKNPKFSVQLMDIDFVGKHLYMCLKTVSLLTLSTTIILTYGPVISPPSPKSDTTDRHLQKVIDYA